MKNGKRVRRDESPSDISPRGLAGQAAISSFSCPSFSWPLLSSLFSVQSKGVLKVAKRQKFVHSTIYIKRRRCEARSETVLECIRITRAVEILVFGAGAMGSFFGGLLSQRHNVTLIGRAEHISAIKSHGLRVRGKTAIIAKPSAATRVPQNAKPDFVFITTKSYDTANAMIALRPFADRAIFVTLQNGLGNAETIEKAAQRVVAGTTAHGVTFVGPGEIRHAGVGETVLGAWTRVDESDLVRLRDLLADVGIVASVTSDIQTELWSKLVVNASINPIAALAEVPNGRLVRDKRLLGLIENVCREATAVATKPYKLLFDSPLVLNPVAALEATARGGVTLAKIKIENVVASTSLGEELDLQAIALALGGAEYEPEQFPGLIYRLKEPKTATLLFRSGKVVCTGAKSLEHVKTAIDMVAKQIEAAGIPIKKNPVIEVQNIVASSDLGTEINLNAIAISLGLEKVEYEPEQFPGLVYRIDVPKVVVLLFGSGKLVCTGARKPSDVEEAVEKITQELKAAGLLR